MAIINGTNQADFLTGTAEDDVITGQLNRDFLVGLEGNDLLDGGGERDTLDGGIGNDTLLGEGGGDLLIGSSGNDLLDGGAGNNTVDYSGLQEVITIEAAGTINKGSLGSDRISNVRNIIGAVGQANSIDGSTAAGSSVSFDVNLQNNTLKVIGIPGRGNITFSVQNFVDVIGTDLNDRIVGNANDNIIEGRSGADVFIGSAGNDIIAGNDIAGVDDGSIDTVRYEGLGAGITLQARGIVDKGSLGTDELIRVEKIVGDRNFTNTIDAFDSLDVSVDVNLRTNSLAVELDSFVLRRTVINFTNVLGSSGSDTIIDDNSDNLLTGSEGADTIESSQGNDTLAGDEGDDNLIASIGQDVLTGGAGSDTFVLTQNNNISFDDAGAADFAEITDFQSGSDRIQLSRNATFVSFGFGANSLISIDTNNNFVFDESDELIASIDGEFDFENDVFFV